MNLESRNSTKDVRPRPISNRMTLLVPAIIGVALVVGCIVRFAGLTYALPLDVMGDEFGHVATAFSFLNEKTLVASHEFSYVPSLLAVILTPFFALYGLGGVVFGSFSGIDAFTEFAILQSSWFIVGPRILSGIFGVAFLWFLFLFTRRLTNRDTALLAVLFAAFDFWLVHESQVGHLWMPTTTLLLAGFYALLRVAESGSLRWYLTAAFLIGLGYWAGFIPVVLLFWLFVAHWFAPNRKFTNLLWGGGLGIFLIGIISYLNPYSFVRQFGRALRTALETIGISVFPNLPVVSEVSVSVSDKIGLLTRILFFDNPFLVVLGLIGIMLFVYRRGVGSFPVILLGGFSLFYVIVFLFAWPGPDNRYMLPLLPGLLFGAAYAVMAAFENTRGNIVRVSGALALICALSWGIIGSIGYTRLLVAEDTRLAAHAWMIDHIPADSTILVAAKYFELPRNRAVLEYLFSHEPSALRTRDRYLLEHTDRVPTPAYFVLSLGEREALSADASLSFSYMVRSWYRPEEKYSVPEGYTLIATFYPHDPVIPLTDELLQNPDNPFTSLTLVRNLGPYVEVYEKAK